MSITPVSLNANIQTNLLSPLSDAPPAGTTSQGYTPIWMVHDGASTNALQMLGIRTPNAQGDLAVLIAQASLTLDQTSDEARKNQALAGLAGLAAAIASFDIASLQATAARKQTLVDDATADQTDLTTALASLQSQRDTLDSAITSDQQKVAADEQAVTTATQSVSSLNAQIAALDPKASDYATKLASLQTQLGTAQAQLTTAQAQLDTDKVQLHSDRVSRSQVDVKLEQANIAGLDDQIAHVTAELKNAPAGSDEATALQATLDQLTQQRSDANSRLTTFQGLSSPSDAQFDGFSGGVQSDIAVTTSDLQTRITGYKADVATVTNAINSLTLFALAAAAQATASLAADQTQAANHHAALDSNLDRAFSELGDQLQKLDTHLTQQRLNDDDNRRANLQRIEQLGQGLVAGIAGIVSALAQLAAEAQQGAPATQPSAGRFRLNI